MARHRTGHLYVKSPSHTFRIRALLELFPSASYIWVARNPVDLFDSNKQMWSSMFERYGLWEWDRKVLDDFLDVAMIRSANCLDLACTLLAPERFAVIDFSSFTSQPIRTLQLINARFRLASWDIARPCVERVVDRNAGNATIGHASRACQELPGSTRRAMRLLSEAHARALASHGIVQ